MPDDPANTELETVEHWTDSHEAITNNADVLAYAKKYADPGALAVAGHSLEKKLGGSYRLPDDLKTLNEEQRADIVTKMRSLKDLPKTADGYEIKLAEGLKHDEPFELVIKNWAFEKGVPNEDVQGLADLYVNAMNGALEKEAQAAEKDAQKAETEYRMKHGVEYDQKMKEIDMCRMGLAKDLGLTYRVEGDDALHSKLDDALNARDVNGRCLGNNPAILQLLNFVYDRQYKESMPVITGGEEPGSTGKGMFSKDFYQNPTPR